MGAERTIPLCLEDLIERVKQGKRGLTSFIRETTRSVHYVDAEQLQEFDPALRSFVDVDSITALIEAEAMLENPDCTSTEEHDES